MKKMQLYEEVFFYHSHEKCIVGIVRVSNTFFVHNDEIVVELQYVNALKRKVFLKEIKSNIALSDMTIIKQSRLSVSMIKDAEWIEILNLSNT